MGDTKQANALQWPQASICQQPAVLVFQDQGAEGLPEAWCWIMAALLQSSRQPPTDAPAQPCNPSHLSTKLCPAPTHRLSASANVAQFCPTVALNTCPVQGPTRSAFCGLQESSCGCAGVFSAPVALALYATAFEDAGALDRLEGFASLHGPQFYKLPRNSGTTTLRRQEWRVPDTYEFGEGVVVPMCAGQQLRWQVVQR